MRFGNGSNKKDLKRRISARFRSCLVVSCNPALLLSLLYCSLVYGIAQHDTPTFRKRLPAVFRCIRDALCSCVGIGRKSQPFLPKPMRNGLFASIPAEIFALLLPKTTQTHAFPSKPADKSPFVCRKQRRNIRNIHKKEVVGPRKHKSKIANRKLQKNTRIASNRNICEERRQR